VAMRDKGLTGNTAKPEFRDFIGRLGALDKALAEELEHALKRGGFVQTEVRTETKFQPHPLDGARITNTRVDYPRYDLDPYARMMPQNTTVTLEFMFPHDANFAMEAFQTWMHSQMVLPIYGEDT